MFGFKIIKRPLVLKHFWEGNERQHLWGSNERQLQARDTDRDTGTPGHRPGHRDTRKGHRRQWEALVVKEKTLF